MKFFFDFLPVLLFFIGYKFFGDMPPALIALSNQLPLVELDQANPKHALLFATLVLIIASVLQNLLHVIFYHRFEKMHLISLGILLVLGTLTIALKNPDFIKWKVTILNWIFALVIMGSLFIGNKTLIERIMSHAIQVPGPIWRNVTLWWGLFFALIGVLNLFMAYMFNGENDKNWVNFKLFGIFGLTVVFLIAQGFYLSRHAIDTEPEAESEVEK